MGSYCDANCQRNDWHRHKGEECNTLKIGRDIVKDPIEHELARQNTTGASLTRQLFAGEALPVPQFVTLEEALDMNVFVAVSPFARAQLPAGGCTIISTSLPERSYISYRLLSFSILGYSHNLLYSTCRINDQHDVAKLHEMLIDLASDYLYLCYSRGGFARALSHATDPSSTKIVFKFPSPHVLLTLINGLIAGKIWSPCAGGGILKTGFAAIACKADGQEEEQLYNIAVTAAARRGRTIDDVLCLIVTSYRTDVCFSQDLPTVCYLPASAREHGEEELHIGV
jgi:hypothetical protein